MTQAPRLILASASPRRQQLLAQAGYVFTIHPAEIDESDVPPDMLPGDMAQYLAQRKAQAVAAQFPDDVVLAADTVVAFADTALGKPKDPADAQRMLRLLGGTVHTVISGVAVACVATGFLRHTRVLSAVHMRSLSDEEIAQYVASMQWEGKAGGYGIQDPDPFVTRTSGCQTNIVGLPMHTTAELLAESGIRPLRSEAAG
jgi:septum formation protein